MIEIKGQVVPERVEEDTDLFNKVYNPDVLLCLANLSNDEVFTPPEIANQMLDILPQELFEDPNTKFLDPACKSGVFLREIAKRLIKGLEEKIPNLEERIDHICKNQLYGIAITELTSLLSRRSVYCSKYPNGPFSVADFDNVEGNIRFKSCNHDWDGPIKWKIEGRKQTRIWRTCKWCGASEEELGEDNREGLESHAYEFIHTAHPKEIYNMKFDVIISNPPYQLNDGGGTGMSARPIYQHFIRQAKKLNPRYMSMIIPARWFSGGKGLDDFREEMLNDKHIRRLVDYENYKDVFPTLGGLAGGACFFLWDRDNEGPCEITNKTSESSNTSIRPLNEFPIFIRNNSAIEIVKKVMRHHDSGKYLDSVVSSRLPFGITTTYNPQPTGIPCYFTQRLGIKNVNPKDVIDNFGLLDKWKFLVPKAPIAGQTDFSKPVAFYYDGNTRIAKPGECCSESWLVAGAFSSKKETENFKSYIFTKTVRFLLLQTVVSQNITKKNYCFIPAFDTYDKEFTDEYLRQLWEITDDEWNLIQSKIGEIGGEN